MRPFLTYNLFMIAVGFFMEIAVMMIEKDSTSDRQLSRAELRGPKPDRVEFTALPRQPITLVLDRVRQSYNIGAIFRLCDAFLVERLVIAGTIVDLRKRKLVQAARGTQRWVPWEHVENAAVAVAAAKSAGARIVAVEQTSAGVAPENLAPVFPVCLVLGSEMAGIAQEIIDMADAAVTIPMLGMANSINVATAAAIVLHRLSVSLHGRPFSASDIRQGQS
jgi:tRNA G18 (ribose-2'-O)-methylase SpoU